MALLQALQLYKELELAQKGSLDVMMKLANCYKGLHDMQGAQNVYRQILKGNAFPRIYFF